MGNSHSHTDTVAVKRPSFSISRKVIAAFVGGELVAVGLGIEAGQVVDVKTAVAVLVATAVAYFKTEVFPSA